MIKRKNQDPETNPIANTKSTTNIETVLKEKKTMTDRIAIKIETESSIINTREIEIIGGIMIAIEIEMTIEETDIIEITIEIEREIIEDREMEEMEEMQEMEKTTVERKKKK